MDLEHNPRTKQQIKDLLFAQIYDPVMTKYKTWIDDIISRNCHIHQVHHPSMMYRGTLYVASHSKGVPPRAVPLIAASLRSEMDTYLNEILYLNSHEIPYVLGYLNRVLNTSDHLQDYLLLLPSALHPPILALIDSCPCHNNQLDEAQAEAIKTENVASLNLMKQRLFLNIMTK